MKRITVILAFITLFVAGCGTANENNGAAEKSENSNAAQHEKTAGAKTEKPDATLAEIKEKASYTLQMKQGDNPYDIYIYADDESKSVTKDDWACANAGDKVYKGDYKIAAVNKKTEKAETLSIGKQTFQVPNDGVDVVDGKPNLLVVSHCEASDLYNARSFAIDETGKPVEVKDEDGEELALNISPDRIKSTGEQTYQTAIFSNAGQSDWIFYNWKLDTKDWQLKEEKKIIPSDPGEIDMTKWAEDPNYIVE